MYKNSKGLRLLTKICRINLYRQIIILKFIYAIKYILTFICCHLIRYFDFLMMMQNSRLILTDSGGLQEEATIPSISKHVLILRTSTERPEAVKARFSKLVGLNRNAIIGGIQEIIDHPPKLPNHSPFGDGKAGKNIIKILSKECLSR